MPWWQFIVLALASYRVFRLVAADDVIDAPRTWFMGKLGHVKTAEGWIAVEGKVSYMKRFFATMITCHWCLGTWTTLATFATRRRVPMAVWIAIAATAVVGLIGEKLDD